MELLNRKKNKMIKKLALYCYDCIREEFKSSSFRNLKSDKKNIIYETLETTFKNDNENILEIMTKYQLNKSDRALIYGEMFLIGKNKYFTPLIYRNIDIIRENGALKIVFQDDEPILNVGAISSLLKCDDDNISIIIEQLMETINESDFKGILKGLLNLEGLNILENKKAVILAKLPEATAGLLNELQQICKEM